jgi:hypothetical protein
MTAIANSYQLRDATGGFGGARSSRRAGGTPQES